MPCEICGNESATTEFCVRCGRPGVPPGQALLLKGAAEALAAGNPNQAISLSQRVLREGGDSFVARLRLAEGYAAKVAKGEKPLMVAAQREFDEALSRLPADRAAHEAMVALSSGISRLPVLRELYATDYKALPFAAEMARAVEAVQAVRGSRPAGAGGGLPVPGWLLVAVVLAVLAWFGFRLVRPGGAPPGVGTGQPAVALPGGGPGYAPGTNLVVNGTADGRDPWRFTGNATVTGDNPCFRLEGDDSSGAAIVQEFLLPAPRPKYLLIIARTRVQTMPEDRMSGLPYLWGSIRDTQGVVIQWLSGGGNMMHQAEPGTTGVCWGSFELNAQAGKVELYLQQALKSGGTRIGNWAEFDDVGAWLFYSPITAAEFAKAYDGSPPNEAVLAEDAKAAEAMAASPPAPPAAPVPETTTDSGKNFLAAKAMYDRIEPGMSMYAAAEVGGMQAKGSWSKDFGYSMKPGCVTLYVIIRDEKVARVILSKDYEEEPAKHPGRILAEKGDSSAN